MENKNMNNTLPLILPHKDMHLQTYLTTKLHSKLTLKKLPQVDVKSL